MILIGLYAIHSQGLTHGNVSLKNLYLKNCGDGLDFLVIGGFFKARSSSEKIADDYYYSAPQQNSDIEDNTTPKRDSWTAGVIFYEMLADHLPFQSESSSELRRLIEEEEPDYIESID